MPLTVVRVGAPRVARVGVDDEYIPLSVHWTPPGSVGPVYYRAQGTDVGDVELKLEPLTGEIVGLVVIQAPVRHVVVPTISEVSDGITQGSVFVDLSRWELTPDLVPRKEVVFEECALAAAEDESNLYYSLCEESPNRWMMTGPVGFGIGPTNSVTGILLKKK